MSEAGERRDREKRQRAEPGEPPNDADRRTAAAYWRYVETLRAKPRRMA